MKLSLPDRLRHLAESLPKKFLRVKAKVMVPQLGRKTPVEASRTFWTFQKSIRPDGTLSFVECDCAGCNDSAAIEAGNGGVMTIFICKPDDIIWERPGHYDKRYDCLVEDKKPI
jgi:hypothetical protein